MKERKTEITVESYEVLIIARRAGRRRQWCASCDQQVAIISLDDACASGLSRDAVQRQAESGRLHLIETAGGSSLICLNSLMQFERRRHDEEVKRRYTPATQPCAAGVDRLEAEFASVACDHVKETTQPR
ncbi:MAG TPA: hypothetical protein VKA60_24240, partial [Blastocatellia bacterium]|nr:hypothetical protein [Blastocatellia bacterium]